jgi:hypothetical protein
MIFGFHQKSLRSFYVTHRARASGTILFPLARSQFSRQGDRSFQWRMVSAAHSDDLAAWHELHGLGIWYLTVEAGAMNLNVCERTNVFGGPSVSICGMWQAMHWLPGLSCL